MALIPLGFFDFFALFRRRQSLDNRFDPCAQFRDLNLIFDRVTGTMLI